MGETQVVSNFAEQGECFRRDVFGLADDLCRVREQSQLEPCDPPVHPSGGIRACLQLVHPPELILGRSRPFERADQLDEERRTAGVVGRQQCERPLEQVRGSVGIAADAGLRAGLAEPLRRHARSSSGSGRPSSRRYRAACSRW